MLNPDCFSTTFMCVGPICGVRPPRLDQPWRNRWETWLQDEAGGEGGDADADADPQDGNSTSELEHYRLCELTNSTGLAVGMRRMLTANKVMKARLRRGSRSLWPGG